MVNKFAHVTGCACPSCAQIRRNRRATGNGAWDHRKGCGCGPCRQIENLREQAELSKRIKAAKKDRPRSSGKEGCFLTTACCVYRGLPDDCHELECLRSFRDNVLATSTEGRALIAEYYQFAPLIVERLIPQDLDFVWATVKQCTAHIGHQQFAEATQMYVSMVNQLKRKYMQS